MKHVEFVRWVGTAPGTSAMVINPRQSGLGAPCGPTNVWPYITPPAAWLRTRPGAGSPSRLLEALNPYGTDSYLRGTAGRTFFRTTVGIFAGVAGVAVALWYLTR